MQCAACGEARVMRLTRGFNGGEVWVGGMAASRSSRPAPKTRAATSVKASTYTASLASEQEQDTHVPR